LLLFPEAVCDFDIAKLMSFKIVWHAQLLAERLAALAIEHFDTKSGGGQANPAGQTGV
jgi:hypothetical protein